MMEWKATIECWPHSTGEGADVDQTACGPRSADYVLFAEDISKALKAAEFIARGILRNPRAWQAPIMAIVRLR